MPRFTAGEADSGATGVCDGKISCGEDMVAGKEAGGGAIAVCYCCADLHNQCEYVDSYLMV